LRGWSGVFELAAIFEMSAMSVNAMMAVFSGGRSVTLPITETDALELRRLNSLGSLSSGHARRLKIILWTLEGLGSPEIARRAGISVGQVSRIRERFRRGGLAALADRPRSGRGNGLGQRRVEALLALAASPPPRGETRWSLSLLAQTLGLSRSVVYKYMRRHAAGPYGPRIRRQAGP
jgi:transposase